MQDTLTRGLLADRDVRIAWAETTNLANQAVRIHGLGPVAAHVLCRALSGGVLLSTLLEGDERYGMRWEYPGAAGKIFVDVDASAGVRGMMSTPVIAHEVDSPLDVYGAGGTLAIVKSNAARQLSSGTTTTAFADVVGDLGFFFCVSDQVETTMRVLIQLSPDPERPVKLCHGVMLQALPGCDMERFAALADGLAQPEVDQFLGHSQVADNAIERMLQVLLQEDYDGSSLKLFGCPEPEYRCRCSREATFGALRAIPADELRTMIAAGENATVTCEFCRTRQVFEAEELRLLLPGETNQGAS